MNKRRNILLVAIIFVASIFYLIHHENNNGVEINYDWAYFAVGGEIKSADLFLICPTVDTNDRNNMLLSDDKTRAKFLGALNMERGIYEEYTRMYATYYRQATLKVYEFSPQEKEQYLQIAYKDISSAFSYYLKNENKGRPIILAGFSQGADMCYRLLQEYFNDEDIYKKLVAVYAIGWPCTPEMTSKYPQIKPAQSENDLGVVISFECESPNVKSTLYYPAEQRAYAINPLNWKTDETFADKSLNLGACFTDSTGAINKEIINFCGGYLDSKRGVVKIPADDVDENNYPSIASSLPKGAYHIYDYMFFFRNLQQNVKTRIEAYENSL